MYKKQFLFYIILLFNSWLSFSQNLILLNDTNKNIQVNYNSYRYKNKKATLNDIYKIIAAPKNDFTKNPTLEEVNYGFHQPSGWCKFTIKNTSENKNWVLKVRQNKANFTQLYILKSNGTLIKYSPSGHFQNIKDRYYNSLDFAFSIEIKRAETATCYLFTQRKLGQHEAILSIQTEEDFKNQNRLYIVSLSVVIGILLISCIIGFVLYAFINQKIILYYSIYCFSFLLLVMTYTGFIQAYITIPKFQDVFNNFNNIIYYWISGWHILFSIELLGIKRQKEQNLFWIGITMGISYCFAALLLITPLPVIFLWYLTYWSYFIVFLLDIYVLFLVFIKISEKQIIAYFYLAGFVFTLFSATILTLSAFGIFSNLNQISGMFIFTPIVEISCMVIGLGIHFSNTLKEKLNTQKQLNKTKKEIINIQEEERKRIAQDLHDDVGNSLAALKNLLIYNKEHFNFEKEIDIIIKNVRDISHNLIPVNFEDYALIDIVKQTVNKFQKHPSIKFEFYETGAIQKLKTTTELVIYRIINELINNTIKHSEASNVLIQLIYQEDSLVLMVEDNGVGMKNKEITQKEGLGLNSIKHRVEFINAKITIESDPKGTLIIIEIPYARNR